MEKILITGASSGIGRIWQAEAEKCICWQGLKTN